MSGALPGNWDKMIVICAATPWDGIKFQDRHLAEHLSQTMPVLYVDPPLSRFSARHKPWLADSLRPPRLRLMAPSLARLSVIAPVYPMRPGMAILTTQIFRRAMRHACSDLGASVRAVIGSEFLMPPFGVCGEQLKVYWAQDDQVGGAKMTGSSPKRAGRGEKARAHEADVVVASNPSVAANWAGLGYKPILIPFGCDDEVFAKSDVAALPDDVTLDSPIVGFIGGLVPDRIDVRMLEAVAARGHSLLLVGPAHQSGIHGLEQLIARPNVQWVGRKPFEALPSYMRVIDVGLVPYADNAFNRGSFPLKTLEYLAAGRSVVSTDLPATRWLDTDLVRIESSPEAFADGVEQSFAMSRDPDQITARQAFAHGHSWTHRSEQFAEVLLRQVTDHVHSSRLIEH